jgi:hypothetical protein
VRGEMQIAQSQVTVPPERRGSADCNPSESCDAAEVRPSPRPGRRPAPLMRREPTDPGRISSAEGVQRMTLTSVEAQWR